MCGHHVRDCNNNRLILLQACLPLTKKIGQDTSWGICGLYTTSTTVLRIRGNSAYTSQGDFPEIIYKHTKIKADRYTDWLTCWWHICVLHETFLYNTTEGLEYRITDAKSWVTSKKLKLNIDEMNLYMFVPVDLSNYLPDHPPLEWGPIWLVFFLVFFPVIWTTSEIPWTAI